jgi:RND family efflux transporter MFP subunit
MQTFMKTGWLLIPLTTCGVLAGCAQPPAQPPPPKPPEVLVSLPISRSVTDYEDFTGRTEAMKLVEVRARVTGYLEKLNFQEGAEVKQADVLFEIDPRPYQAEFARADASLVQSEAHLRRLESDYQRALGLRNRTAIGLEEFDKIAGDRAEAAAAVGVARAVRDLAKLNLGFTHVTSPIAGRISRRLVDPGNMVKADETALTTVVSLDPMYAYFDVDERTVLRIRRLIQEGKTASDGNGKATVLMGLADEDGFPHQGAVDFVDNKVDPNTGSLWLRGVFPNPTHILTPGLFVRIRLPIGMPYKATLIAEQALGRDQGQKFVYVVSDKNEVAYRPVKVGKLHDGLRVITEGLTARDKVVVSGLQRIRQGATVEPKMVSMPGVAGSSQ